MQIEASGPEPRRSLLYLDAEQRLLCERLVDLSPAQFEQPSNLPGWRVVDLGVHITRVCDSILLAVQRASVGDKTPAFGAAAKPREDEIRAMDPSEWVNLQRDAYRQLTGLVAELSDEQLEQLTFPHPQGQRSIRWFCTQLLAEVGFHRWDLDWSLGGQGSLDNQLATYLLPFLLDPAEPLFGFRRAPGDKTETFSLMSGGIGWTLTATSDSTTVRGQRSSMMGPEPVIQATPGWLALAAYGRVRVDRPPFHINGAADTADRFAAVFGPLPWP